MRFFAVWCARESLKLVKSPDIRSIEACNTAERFANAKKYLVDDFDIFLVANDKYNMYPTIAENAGMQIANQYKRPVLNRTEKDKGAYSEIIFHLKKKEQ
jgi:hypothetical protein